MRLLLTKCQEEFETRSKATSGWSFIRQTYSLLAILIVTFKQQGLYFNKGLLAMDIF